MNIRAIRESKNIALVKLAKNAGISSSFLSEIERGIRTNPSKETMDKIAEALGCTVHELFYDGGGSF